MNQLRLCAASAALWLVLASIGCGDDSDDVAPGVDAGHDATGQDATTPPDEDAALDDGGITGVECGDDVCTAGQSCCITQGDATCIDEGDPCDEGWAASCTPGEGQCDEGQECCVGATGAQCVTEGTCDPLDGDCTRTADCSDGDMCCLEGTVSSCADECDAFVRCGEDDECTETGAGDCCRQGICTDVCVGGPPAG